VSDSDTNTSWWTVATAPRNPLEAAQRARRIAQTPAPIEEPPGNIDDASAIEAVARHAGEFVGLRSPEPRPALTVEQRIALNMANVHDTTGTAGRTLDPSYRDAQINAQRSTGLAVPTRYTNPGS
jgi:hypothetical protein